VQAQICTLNNIIGPTLTASRFPRDKLDVHVNMIHLGNGQSQSEPEQSKPKGRFTGERLLRERPRVYRKVVELLAEPGTSINQITKRCRVSEHTVRAVRDREAVSIAERKQRLTSIFGNIAELGAERMEELAPHATLRDAGMAAGIATDKLLALSSDPFSPANQQHLHVHLQKVDLLGQFNQALAQLRLLPNADAPGDAPSDGCATEEKDRAKRE
jgi:hypothetical protein